MSPSPAFFPSCPLTHRPAWLPACRTLSPPLPALGWAARRCRARRARRGAGPPCCSRRVWVVHLQQGHSTPLFSTQHAPGCKRHLYGCRILALENTLLVYTLPPSAGGRGDGFPAVHQAVPRRAPDRPPPHLHRLRPGLHQSKGSGAPLFLSFSYVSAINLHSCLQGCAAPLHPLGVGAVLAAAAAGARNRSAQGQLAQHSGLSEQERAEPPLLLQLCAGRQA